MRLPSRRAWPIASLAGASLAAAVAGTVWATRQILGGWLAPGGPLGSADWVRPVLGIGYRAWAPALAVVGLAVISVACMAVRLVRQLRCSTALRAQLGLRTSTPEDVAWTAFQAGVDRLDVVEDRRALCLCHGLAKPRVVISTGLLARLSQTELLAVLAHEASHSRHFDPLALLAARVGRAGLWFLPFVGRLLRLCELRIELAADAAAVQLAGRSSLVAALLAMGEDPGPSPVPRAASANRVLELRTEALWAQRLPRVCSATHLWAACVLVLGLAWAPMFAWVAPPPFRAPMIGQVHVLR